jgi:hypothetical protein
VSGLGFSALCEGARVMGERVGRPVEYLGIHPADEERLLADLRSRVSHPVAASVATAVPAYRGVPIRLDARAALGGVTPFVICRACNGFRYKLPAICRACDNAGTVPLR